MRTNCGSALLCEPRFAAGRLATTAMRTAIVDVGFSSDHANAMALGRKPRPVCTAPLPVVPPATCL
jgi:hypothetical protein